MADMNFFTDFKKLWGSTGTIEPVTQDQYQLGWAYIGALPPAVEQFNKVQQLSDEKAKWLYTQIESFATAHGIPLNASTIDAIGLALAQTLLTYAPLASPLFTGDPKGPTPPQFDNDTSIATTAFVQRAVGNHSKIMFPVGNLALGADYAGSLSIVTGTNPVLTLPSAASVPGGTTLSFFMSTGNCTIQGAGGDKIVVEGGGSASSILVPNLSYLTLVQRGGTIWSQLSGDAQLAYSDLFAKSLATNGYQKFPSGLIIQWGQGVTNAAGAATVTLPIAFPGAPILGMTNANGMSSPSSINMTTGVISSTQLNAYAATSAGAGVAIGFNWIAIGK